MEPENAYDAYAELEDRIPSLLTDAAARLAGAVLIFFGGILLIRMIMRALRAGRIVRRADSSVTRFVLSSLNILFYVLLLISVVAVLGVPVSSLVALVASAGVAVGLALQGALGNLAGGAMILLFRPFRTGDYITVGDFDGTVSEIGVFYTRLITPDRREITVPNGNVINETLVNYSAQRLRRLDLDVRICYGTDLAAVRAILTDEAEKHPSVLRNPAPVCRVTDREEDALLLSLRAWVRNTDYWDVRFDLLEAVSERLTREGIPVPFRTVKLRTERKKNGKEDSDT